MDPGGALGNELEVTWGHSGGRSGSFPIRTEEDHLMVADDVGEPAAPDHGEEDTHRRTIQDLLDKAVVLS